MFIYGFNEACENIAASYLKVGDDSMSAIRFWTTAKWDLPHLSYIFRNPEPLGTDFNTVACYVTAGSTNPGGTRKPDKPLKGIRNPIPQ